MIKVDCLRSAETKRENNGQDTLMEELDKTSLVCCSVALLWTWGIYVEGFRENQEMKFFYHNADFHCNVHAIYT